MSLRIKLAAGPFPPQGPVQLPGFSEGLLVWLEQNPSPLTCISVWLVLSRDQLGLWGGGVHLVRPGSRKSIFLEKGRLRERSGFPQATERPQFLLKPYRALHRFPTPPLSASGPVLWESGNSREATAGARRPVSSSVSLASSCQGRPRASPNRDGLKLGLALKH